MQCRQGDTAGTTQKISPLRGEEEKTGRNFRRLVHRLVARNLGKASKQLSTAELMRTESQEPPPRHRRNTEVQRSHDVPVGVWHIICPRPIARSKARVGRSASFLRQHDFLQQLERSCIGADGVPTAQMHTGNFESCKRRPSGPLGPLRTVPPIWDPPCYAARAPCGLRVLNWCSPSSAAKRMLNIRAYERAAGGK